MESKKPGVIFIHGWRGNKESNEGYVQALEKLGYLCKNIDLPGHGECEGDINTLTRKDFLEFMLTIYDEFVKDIHADKESISIVGTSFGGYLALLMSKERKIHSIALRAPADYPDENFDSAQRLFAGDNQAMLVWRKTKRAYPETKSLMALHNFMGKILIVESEHDEIVPKETIENYCAAVQDKKMLTHKMLYGAPHSLRDTSYKEMYSLILADWFSEL